MAGATALLRSAASTRKKVLAQQDAYKAYEFAISLKTPEEYDAYSKYLQQRAKSSTDPSALLSLQKTQDSAYKSFISNEIQRQTIGVMEGTTTNTNKFNTIVGYMNQAQAMGQYDLAQQLDASLGSLYNTIQAENDRAIAAQERMANFMDKQATAQSNAAKGMVETLKANLSTLNHLYASGDLTAYNKAAQKFVDDHRDFLEGTLGQKIPQGVVPNIGQLTQGTVEAIQTYYQLAADAIAPVDAGKQAEYQAEISKIASGETKFNGMTRQEIAQYALNPDIYVSTPDGMKRKATVGYQIDPNTGNVIPLASKQIKQVEVNKNGKKQLEALGFGDVTYNADTGAYRVQITDKASQWLDTGAIGKANGEYIDLTSAPTGFQLYNSDQNSLYNIALDNKGLGGLYKMEKGGGQTHIGGQYGFNQNANNLVQQATFLRNQKQIEEYNKAIAAAQNVRNGTIGGGNTALSIGSQAKNYLNSQGVTNNVFNAPANSAWAKDYASTPASIRAYGSALALQPWYESRGNIGGKYYNYAGEYIPGYAQRAGGGFNFVDANGNPISAKTYANQAHADFGQLLSYLGSKGDTYAAQYASNPNAAPSSLTWGS